MAVLTMPISVSGYAGPTAVFVEEQMQNNLEFLQQSNALGLIAKGTFRRLEEIFEECSAFGWDGEKANPISKEVLLYTKTFLQLLPLGIEPPEISAEPDGAITLEWYRSPRKVLSISINPDGCVYYAGLVGTSRRHGVDCFLISIPDNLLSLIAQITREK